MIAVFQPHLFSRTRYLQREFGRALTLADEAIVCDIFPAREEPEPGVTGKLVVDAYLAERPGGPVYYLPRLGDAVRHLQQRVRDGDLVLTIGAGDVVRVGERLLAALAPSDDRRPRGSRTGAMKLAAIARRRWLVTAALVALIVVIPLALYAWGRSSPVFEVRHIVFTGERPAHTRHLRAALIEAFRGENLFTVTGASVRKALARFPYVHEVSIDRAFPDTLKVTLSEFVPAALLLSERPWFVVSTEGRVLAKVEAGSASPSPGTSGSPATGSTSPSQPSGVPDASPAPDASAPPSSGGASGAGGDVSGGEPGAGSRTTLMTVATLPHPPAGAKLPASTRRLPVLVADVAAVVGQTVTDAHVRDALSALAALPRPLARRAAGAAATTTSIRLLLTGGPVIEVGDTTELRAKMLALQAVLSRYAARHVACTFVDVSVPGRPLAAPMLPVQTIQVPSAPTPTATATP